MNFPKIKLKKGKDRSLLRFHRWVFSGAIEEIPDGLSLGDWVEVFAHDGKYLATGYYQNNNITVRIVSFRKTEIDLDFWIQRFEYAIRLRKKLKYIDNNEINCFRLINGEGDELPGLIVDWYNGTAVIQSHSEGIRRSSELIAKAIIRTMGNKVKSIFHRSTFSFHAEESGEYIYGLPGNLTILENNLIFNINIEKGQKTGYFLDQRDNRLLLRSLSEGALVLDAFCYAGGFSVNALKGGASFVDAIDIAPVAIQLAGDNLESNNFTGKYNLINSDVLKFLQQTSGNYDIIILDPPAYAKHISSRHNAVQGYKRLNQVAFGKIKSGGLLFTFSCSQVVDKLLFENTIMAAAIESGRMARILYRLGQPADHPVNIFHPESEYLKGLVLEIE